MRISSFSPELVNQLLHILLYHLIDSCTFNVHQSQTTETLLSHGLVFRRYVFNLLSEEKDLSASQEETGRTANIFNALENSGSS